PAPPVALLRVSARNATTDKQLDGAAFGRPLLLREVMVKKIAVWLLIGCCALAHAQTAQELLNDGKNTEIVTTHGMGYDMKRYSPLRQINTSTVKRLVPIWSTSLANDLGEQAQPMV